MTLIVRRIVALTLVCLVLAIPAAADTKNGRANRTTVERWSFTPVGPGQVQITLSWTNKRADLIMVLVCGIAESNVFGIAAGGLDRVAMINAGVESDVPCEVGVSSDKGTSAYRIHFQHAISQPTQGLGRMPLALTVGEGQDGSMLQDAVTRGLEQVRQLIAAKDGATRRPKD